MKFLNKKTIASLAAALLLSFGSVASAFVSRNCEGTFYKATPNTVCSLKALGAVADDGSIRTIAAQVYAWHKGGPTGYTVFANLIDKNNVRVAAVSASINRPENGIAAPSTWGSAVLYYKPKNIQDYTLEGGINFESARNSYKAITSTVSVWYNYQ